MYPRQLICDTLVRAFKAVFLKLGSAEPQLTAKGCQGFGETKICNGGRVLLGVLNLYLRIKSSCGDIRH